MFRNITIGQYFPGESPVHRLDPRTKIFLTLVMVVGLFFIESMMGYAFIAALAVVIIFTAGLPLRFVLRGIRPLVIILILTFALHLFLNEGRTLFTLGPLVATYEGAYKGLLMVSRLILLILVTSLLTLTTSPIALTDGVESFLSPFRRIGVPAHELAMMMTIALRFVPTLLEETEKIMKAQMARGADFETGNVFRRAKSLVPLLVPLFVSAFRRADELATAMEARCYRGGKGRTRMRELEMAFRDYVAIGVTVAIICCIAVYL